MLFFFFILSSNSAFSFPNFLTTQEILEEGQRSLSWQCFHVSQIKNMDCREWLDYDNSEKSDMDLVVENDNAIYSYGFNNAHHVCKDIKKDMVNVLRNQKYFCILANHFALSNFKVRGKNIKPIVDGVYKCLNTPIGKVGWFGEFGICLE